MIDIGQEAPQSGTGQAEDSVANQRTLILSKQQPPDAWECGPRIASLHGSPKEAEIVFFMCDPLICKYWQLIHTVQEQGAGQAKRHLQANPHASGREATSDQGWSFAFPSPSLRVA